MGARNRPSAGGAFQATLPEGAKVGAAAFLVNFVGAYLFMTIDGVKTSYDIGGVDTLSVPGWKMAGMLLFGSQNVKLSASVSQEDTEVLSRTSNPISGDLAIERVASTVPEPFYYALPVLVLAGAGYLVVNRAGTPDGAPSIGAGMSIVAGYGPLAFVALFLCRVSNTVTGPGGSATISLAPELSGGLLLAVLCYPLVLGAVGGMVADGTGTATAGGTGHISVGRDPDEGRDAED